MVDDVARRVCDVKNTFTTLEKAKTSMGLVVRYNDKRKYGEVFDTPVMS